jgi:hypothetical protein
VSAELPTAPELPRSLKRIGWLIYIVVSLISPRFDFKAIVSDRPYLALQQLADPVLLHHHLLDTLWNLHMQPPLYNLEVGLLLQLPTSLGALVARLFCGALFVATGAWTYKSMVRLGVNSRWAFWVVVVLVYANPANLSFGLSILYVGTAAALTTALAYHGIVFVQEGTPKSARRFAWFGVALSLYVTSQQPVMFLIITAVLAASSKTLRRALGRGALVPLLVLIFFIGHTVFQFGTPMTSTWGGMNLARVTTDLAPRSELQELINRREVSSLVLTPAFSSLSDYGVSPSTSGARVRTQVTKAGGTPNYNNDVYRRVADDSLVNGWHYIQQRPGRYVHNVARGLGLWLVPSEQYFLSPTPTTGVLASYQRIYDVAVNWQASSVSAERSQSSLRTRGVNVANWSFLALVSTGAALLGGAWLVVVRWRRNRKGALEILLPWLIWIQGFVIMNLSDVGENQRFRFQLGTVALTVTATFISTGWQRLRRSDTI